MFYYHLRIPSWMHKFFVIRDVSIEEFRKSMSARGWSIPAPPPEMTHIAVQVLIMGFAWACWASNASLQDIPSAQVETMKASNRLVYGLPIPFFFVTLKMMVHFQYIDDFGGVVLSEGQTDEEALGLARSPLEQCRLAVKKFGLGCHKDGVGFSTVALGARLGAVPERDLEVFIEPTSR